MNLNEKFGGKKLVENNAYSFTAFPDFCLFLCEDVYGTASLFCFLGALEVKKKLFYEYFTTTPKIFCQLTKNDINK